MEHLILILAAALTLIGAAFSKLLADEFKAWAPSLISSILAVAVRALPHSRRKRCEEEWKSHVDALPGDLSKLIVACGCVFAAWRLGIVWRIAAEPFAVSKRVVDIVLALTSIVALAPILIVAFLATVVTSPGPALFRHRRVGRHGKHIHLIKFRTMVTDASERLSRLLDSDPAAAAEWAANRNVQVDPRVTAVGAFMRKWSVDELPQLFNVLKGDMSLVGPRPITAEEPHRYSSKVDAYLTCRPGITGLWQINCSRGNAFDKRVALDTFYSSNWSMMLDAKIILGTLPALFENDAPPELQDKTPNNSRRILRILFAVCAIGLVLVISFAAR